MKHNKLYSIIEIKSFNPNIKKAFVLGIYYQRVLRLKTYKVVWVDQESKMELLKESVTVTSSSL